MLSPNVTIPGVGMIESPNKNRASVKITVDKAAMAAVVHRLAPYKNISRLFKPALEEVADYVREEMIPDTFHSEGPGWPQLAHRTQHERQKAGYPPRHPILKRTGDLMKELTEKSHPNHIEIIKTGRFARIEIGGSSKKFIENQLGLKSARLPARPMIPGTGNVPLQSRQQTDIANIIRRSIQQTYGT